MSNLIYRTLEVLMDLLKDSGRVKEVQAITESHKIESAVHRIIPGESEREFCFFVRIPLSKK